MSKAIFLQHAAHAGPGRIIPLFRDFGIPTEVRHLYKGDAVPTDAELDEVRVLVSLPGPMSATDTAAHPFLADEIDLLKKFTQKDRPVLGISLGAQLLALAGGGKVYPNAKPLPPAPHPKPGEPPPPPAAKPEPVLWPEFGWNPVTFPFPGGTDPMVFGMIDGAPMLHWHRDTFDLPKLPAPPNPAPPPAPPPPTGNALLSSSKLCRNQAFRFKNRLFGFQYHIHQTREGIEALLAADQESLTAAHGPAGGEALDKFKKDTETLFPRYERLTNKLLNNYVQFLKAY